MPVHPDHLALQRKYDLLENTQYRTISETGESLFKDRGSKFLGRAEYCTNEKQAKEIIESLRKQHPQAVHVCSAFRFGAAMKLYRSSDDGEPSNSAGPPILGQIQSFDMTNVLVTVVRYYGGVNLGVGGLINAYRTSAKEALSNAVIIVDEDRFSFSISFGYDQVPKVMQIMKNGPASINKQDFGETCSIDFSLKASDLSFISRLEGIENTSIEKHE